MAYITRPNSWVSQDAAATTQLTYALQLNPAPLTVSIAGRDPVLAALEFVITNPSASAILVNSVSITIQVGNASSNLTTTTANVSTSVSDSTNWLIKPPGTITNGPAIYTLIPQTGSSVKVDPGASIVVEIFNFPTVENPGNTTITIKETTGSISFTSFLVSTFPSGFYFGDLSATAPVGSQLIPVAQVDAGTTVTLVWNSSVVDLASFTIYYSNAALGQQQVTPSDTGIWTSGTLTSDTVFTIVVTVSVSGGSPLTAALSTAVAVHNPSLIAASIVTGTATVTGPLTVSGDTQTNALAATGVNVTGDVNASGKLTADTANIKSRLRIEGGLPTDALSIGGVGALNVDAPGIVGGRFTVQNNGKVGINQPNPQTALDIAGSLTVSGKVSLTGNLIGPGNFTLVGGWGAAPKPTLQFNSSWASVGGVTVNKQSGFAQTYGAGNYGYFGIDLGQLCSGLLSVSIIVARANGGVGLWNIISTQKPVSGFSGNFQTDTSATQLWNLYQDIANGQIFPVGGGPWAIPIQTTLFFKNARSFYIGAVDLGNGQICLKLNSISIVPMALS